MRRWLDSDNPEPGQMKAWVPEMFARISETENEGVVRWRSGNDRAVTQNYVVECVTKLEPILMKEVIPFEYEPEVRFEAIVRIPYLTGNPTSIKLVGGIDIVTKRGNDFVNLDLKSTQNESYINQTLAQAYFYDLGFQYWYGKRPVAFKFIQPMCKQQVVPVTITEHERTVMMDRIIKMAHGMWRKEWEPKESDTGCSQCDCKHACDKFKLNLKTVGTKKTVSLSKNAE